MAKKPKKLSALVLDRPINEQCQNSSLILAHAHGSATALLDAFERARKDRGPKKGMTTDEEQDLLRAMLVMAAAGLDAMLKQLIRDTLPYLVDGYPEVKKGLEDFVTRQVQGEGEVLDSPSGRKFLARVLAASSQQKQVIEEYIRYLTGGSLQSADALFGAAAALGVSAHGMSVDPKKLKEIFDIRNKIIHELDINLEAESRKRNLRRLKDMIDYTNTLMVVAQKIRDVVNDCLTKSRKLSFNFSWKDPAISSRFMRSLGRPYDR